MQIIYENDRLILSPFSRDLIKETNSQYLKWFYDSEVTRFNSHGLFPYGKDKMEKYLDMCESGKEDIVWGIVYKVPIASINGEKIIPYLKHIGNVSLQRINWIYRSAEFAIVIGEKDYWNQGIAVEALTQLLNHGFNKLNLHRIWTGTASVNYGMRRTAEKLGMKEEGQFIDGMFLHGKYYNVVCYSIEEEAWRNKTNEA